MFPRETAVLALINDGRWKLEPNPVNWTIMPTLAQPLGYRRDPVTGLTVVLMSPPTDCFTLACPHQTEGHYSLYLSLFGRTLKAGEEARARTRLVVMAKAADEEILKLYQDYLKEIAGRP